MQPNSRTPAEITADILMVRAKLKEIDAWHKANSDKLDAAMEGLEKEMFAFFIASGTTSVKCNGHVFSQGKKETLQVKDWDKLYAFVGRKIQETGDLSWLSLLQKRLAQTNVSQMVDDISVVGVELDTTHTLSIRKGA